MFDFVKNISPTEILVIAFILTMFFGAKFVNGLARTSGETLKEAKKIKKNFIESFEDSDKTDKGTKEVAN